ncbi:MAG: heme ABC transporter substrate-binding protein IsdE [Peptostreptococcaceae bacterium]
MKMKKTVMALLGVLTLTFAVGCSNSEGNNNDAISDNDNREEVVVATSVAVTEILDALGVKVSGVPTSSYELPESTKDAVKVGNPMSPDLEIIKSLNPTCVVSVDTLGSDYEKLFVENNIPSEFVNLQTLDGLKETILSLGEKFEKVDEANTLLENLANKEVEVENKSQGKENPKVLIIFGAPGSVMVGTDNSYVGNLVEIVGGENIFKGTNSSFMQVNMEEIIKSNPDKILVMTHALPDEAKKTVEDEFAKNTSWKNVKAIQEGEVHYLENGYFGMSANLKVIEALDMLGAILYE